jgi:hypothetical protein
MKNNLTTFQCIRKQPTLITDHSSRGANTNACHVLGSVAPGAPIQFSVRICHIFIQSCVHQWEDSGKALLLVASFCTLSQVRLQQITAKVQCLNLYSIGQELRCWKRGQNRQEEESILCYRGHITPSITLHPHGNCVEVLQIKVLSIIFVYTNLSISPMCLFC